MVVLKTFAALTLLLLSISFNVSAYVIQPASSVQGENGVIASSDELLYTSIFNSSILVDSISEAGANSNEVSEQDACAQAVAMQYFGNLLVIGTGMCQCMSVGQADLNEYFSRHSPAHFQTKFENKITLCTFKKSDQKIFKCYVDTIQDSLHKFSYSSDYFNNNAKFCIDYLLHEFAQTVQQEPSNVAQCYNESNQPSNPPSNANGTSPGWNTTASPPWWNSTASPPFVNTTAFPPWWNTTASPPWWNSTASPPWWNTTASPPWWNSTASPPWWNTTASPPWWNTTASPPWWNSTASPSWWNTTASPPWWNTTASPNWNTTAWPTWNTTSWPNWNTTAWPTWNTTSWPNWNTTAWPTWNTTSWPNWNTSAWPTWNTTSLPNWNTTELPTWNTTSWPSLNTTALPIWNTTSWPTWNTTANWTEPPSTTAAPWWKKVWEKIEDLF